MAIVETGPLEALWSSIRRHVLRNVTAAAPDARNSQVVVWRESSSEDHRWFEVARRDDGLHTFSEWRRETISDPITGTYEHKFPVFESGLYESEDEAIAAAGAYIQNNVA